MPAAAYCDVDGTLTATTIVTPMLWFRRRRNTLADKLWIASLPLRGPWWLMLDRLSRGASNRAIYSNYRGFNAAWMRENANACFEQCLKPRFHHVARMKLEELKQSGARLVLVTGSIDFLMRPLADYLGAELIAPGLLESNGKFTGAMNAPPLTGAEKSSAIRAHAEANGIDLAASFALGDAYGDCDMLSAVGHPIAVNPDSRLRKIAMQRKWEILAWSPGYPRTRKTKNNHDD